VRRAHALRSKNFFTTLLKPKTHVGEDHEPCDLPGMRPGSVRDNFNHAEAARGLRPWLGAGGRREGTCQIAATSRF
jgi:hypothetical protein